MAGKSEPGMEDLLKLASYFKIDPYELVYSERPQPPPLVFGETADAYLVDAALNEMEDLKEKVSALDRALKRLKKAKP